MAGAHPKPFAIATRAEAVAEELRRLIQSGALEPGTRLRQVHLARHFGVSTTPVRAALTGLAREGLVVQEPNRGVIVASPSASELRENYEIRAVLEPLATALAAPVISDEAIRQLDGLLADMRDALVAGELARYVNELNPQFHGVIYRSARRPTLAQLIDKLRQCARVYALALAQSSTPSVDFAAVHREHEQIVAALRARESQAASGIMRLHVERSAHQLLASLVEPLR